jgi:hypothetical protein
MTRIGMTRIGMTEIGMTRRRLLLAGLATATFGVARAGLPVPPGERIAFHIIRNGGTIGEHSISFARTTDAVTVSIAADIVVGIGPIAFFRYRHRATVRWQGEQVVSIDAETDDDGTSRRMAARRDETGLVVEGSKATRYVAAT